MNIAVRWIISRKEVPSARNCHVRLALRSKWRIEHSLEKVGTLILIDKLICLRTFLNTASHGRVTIMQGKVRICKAISSEDSEGKKTQ